MRMHDNSIRTAFVPFSLLPFQSALLPAQELVFRNLTMSGAMNSTTIQVPNPYAQLAWMAPNQAGKLSSKLYGAVGTLAVGDPFYLSGINLHILLGSHMGYCTSFAEGLQNVEDQPI
jgi:hypothetical protein